MTYIRVNQADLWVEQRGHGEVIVFCHGLLWDRRLFAHQVKHLEASFRCVSIDFRGQGRSQVTGSGYDMDTLADDVIAVLEHLDLHQYSLVGLSMGGFVAMRIARSQAHNVTGLVLLNTTAGPEPQPNKPRYRMLNLIAGCLGLRPVAGSVMRILFGKTFMADPDRRDLRQTYRRRLISNRRRGITRAVKAVIDRRGVSDAQLRDLLAPTLVIAGEEDVATPPSCSEHLAATIPNARLRVIPAAGHTTPLEAPQAVTDAIHRFLTADPE